MSEQIVPPTDRTCERCGRHDRWDPDEENWTIVEVGGEGATGAPNCIHEWDINGRYNPVRDSE